MSRLKVLCFLGVLILVNVVATELVTKQLSTGLAQPSDKSPFCQEFVVVESGVSARSLPWNHAKVIKSYDEGEEICVVSEGINWYLIDLTPATVDIARAFIPENAVKSVFSTPESTPLEDVQGGIVVTGPNGY